MPLEHSSSPGAFKRNVSTLMGEVGESPHVQSRKQALAIAYATQRRGNKRQDGGDVGSDTNISVDVPPNPPNALTGEPMNPASIAGQEARGSAGWAQGSAPGGFDPGSAGWWREALPVSTAAVTPATTAAAPAAPPATQDSLAAFYQNTINQIPPEFADYRRGVGTQLQSLYYNQRGAWPTLQFAGGGDVPRVTVLPPQTYEDYQNKLRGRVRPLSLMPGQTGYTSMRGGFDTGDRIEPKPTSGGNIYAEGGEVVPFTGVHSQSADRPFNYLDILAAQRGAGPVGITPVRRPAAPVLPFPKRAEGGEIGGLVNHDRDPDLPPVQDHAEITPVMPTPRGYQDPAYIGVIQRLLEGQRRLNAMHPAVREQLRRYWLGGLIRRMYGGPV